MKKLYVAVAASMGLVACSGPTDSPTAVMEEMMRHLYKGEYQEVMKLAVNATEPDQSVKAALTKLKAQVELCGGIENVKAVELERGEKQATVEARVTLVDKTCAAFPSMTKTVILVDGRWKLKGV